MVGFYGSHSITPSPLRQPDTAETMIACLQGHAGGLPPQDFLEDGEPLLDANCASADSAPIESSSTDAPEPMTGERLRQVIEKVAEYGPNPVGHQIRFELEGVGMTCIYDETHDRMRIIAPIRHYTKVTAAQRDAMMWANFHTTLDARYCVSEDILYAAFMHPLGSLTEDQVLSAVYQVLSLHRTFGDQYSSGLLKFIPEDYQD